MQYTRDDGEAYLELCIKIFSFRTWKNILGDKWVNLYKCIRRNIIT